MTRWRASCSSASPRAGSWRLASGSRTSACWRRSGRWPTLGLAHREVDRLYGAVSPGATLLPSGLFAVHEGLGLRRDAKVVPIQSEFTNFVDALGCACDAVAAGRCARVLVVVAAGWSRLVDYADAGAAGIGDGAGAVVVGAGPPPGVRGRRDRDPRAVARR